MKALMSSAVGIVLLGCVSVPRGPVQRIRLESRPPGAEVHLSDCGLGSTDGARTPVTVFVNRRATRCAITFIDPQYGKRTIVLVRREISAEEEALLTEGDTNTNSIQIPTSVPELAGELAELVLAELVVEPLAHAVGRGFDELTGARYEQHRNHILVDLTTPDANLAGSFTLVAVNGQELPASTWFPRNRPCEIRTTSGLLVLEKGNLWRVALNEMERCGDITRPLPNRTAEGVFSVKDDRLVLESEGFVDVGVLQDDRLEVTLRGQGFRHGQKAVYTYTRAR